MIKFHCQPEYYADRSYYWEIDAPEAKTAAERFQAVYDGINPPDDPDGSVEVRVIHPDASEQVFDVEGVTYTEYIAKEKK